MEEEENNHPQLKKNMILFRRSNGEVFATMQTPKYFRLTKDLVFDLTGLRSKLKMLFVDVLCRGYHPVRGFQQNFRNVFKDEESSMLKNSGKKSSDIIKIQNTEATSTIWKCLSRQLGKPYKNYEIQQVQKQLYEQMQKIKSQIIPKSTQFESNKINTQKYNKIKKQLEGIDEKIKEQMKQIIKKSKQDEIKSIKSQAHVAKVLQQQILNCQHDIFFRSIVGIRQVKNNPENVQIILEQCYPSIILNRQKAIQVLSSQFFNKKLNQYKVIQQEYSQQPSIYFCHRCLIPINHLSRRTSCSDKLAKTNIKHSIMTDPYMYCKRIINQNVWDKDQLNYIHPYLVYYQTKISKVALCNRYYCNRCEGSQIQIASGNCSYCEGLCSCARCRGMDQLTQMMAVFIDNRGNLRQLINKFLMKFQTNTLDNISTEKELKLNSLQIHQKNFEYYYDACHDQKILLQFNQVQEFKKDQYFSKNIQQNQDIYKKKLQVYRQKIIKLPLSKLDRLQIEKVQKQKNKRIASLNEIICGNKRQDMIQKQRLKRQEREKQKQRNKQIQRQKNIQRQKQRQKWRQIQKYRYQNKQDERLGRRKRNNSHKQRKTNQKELESIHKKRETQEEEKGKWADCYFSDKQSDSDK